MSDDTPTPLDPDELPDDLTHGEPALPARLHPKALFEGLLRSPRALVARLAEPGHGALPPLLGLAAVSFLVFGVVLGCFATGTQLWAAPLKLLLGLAVAAVICFPSLYIFSCLSGSRAGVGQLAAVLAGVLALAGLLLLGFAPAVWIFTQATDSLGFMGSLVIAAWLIAVLFGFRFLRWAMAATGGDSRGPITVWCVVFLLVTLQMTTSLRPILGRSDRFLTDEKRFFIQHWFQSSGDQLPTNPQPWNSDTP